MKRAFKITLSILIYILFIVIYIPLCIVCIFANGKFADKIENFMDWGKYYMFIKD